MVTRWILCVGMAVLFLAALAVPSPVAAKAQFGIAGFGGYESYSMSDVNDELIDEVNADPVVIAGGYQMDDISGGWGYGGGLRIITSEKIVIWIDYNRLAASSDLSIQGATFFVETPANSYLGTVAYLFPSASRARIGLAGGFGYYSSAGSVGFDVSGSSAAVDLEGNGFGFHGLVVLDATLSPAMHAEIGAGYRYAKTSDLTVDGVTAVTLSGEEASLDWSGFMSRVGLAFYFGNK